MINSSPDRLGAIRPLHAVVEGAAGKEDDCGQSEDPQSHAAPEPVGDGDQSEPSDEAEWAHDEMDDPSELRGELWRQLMRQFLRQIGHSRLTR